GQNPRGPVVPGTADAHRHRRRELHHGGSRRATTRDGIETLVEEDATVACTIPCGSGGERTRRGTRRAHLPENAGLRRLRVSGEPRTQLRAPGVRQRILQALLPGRVLRGVTACPADGILFPTVS